MLSPVVFVSAAHPRVRGNGITMQSNPERQSCTESQWDLGPDGELLFNFCTLKYSPPPFVCTVKVSCCVWLDVKISRLTTLCVCVLRIWRSKLIRRWRWRLFGVWAQNSCSACYQTPTPTCWWRPSVCCAIYCRNALWDTQTHTWTDMNKAAIKAFCLLFVLVFFFIVG